MLLSRQIAAAGVAFIAAVPSRALPQAASESSRAIALLRESRTAALAITDERARSDLLRELAYTQTRAGDHEGAMETARALGPWRLDVQAAALCRMIELRRFDDAYAFAQRLSGTEREWALARLASSLADLDLVRRVPPFDTLDRVNLTRRAFAVAGEVRDPDARVDAFVSVGYKLLYVRMDDSARAATAFEAARLALPGVRDPERRSHRAVTIARGLGDLGRTDAAIALLTHIQRDDRFDLAFHMRDWRDVRTPRVMALLRTIAALLDSVPDARARHARTSTITGVYRALGDSAVADSIDRVEQTSNPTNDRLWVWNAFPWSILDSAVSLAPSDPRQAIALVDTLSDPHGVGRRPRAYLRLVDAVRSGDTATASLVLRRARQSAIDARLPVSLRDELLILVAREQVSRRFFDDAVPTIDRIANEDDAAGVLHGVGGSAPTSEALRHRHALVVRLANPDVRRAGTARTVEQTLETQRPAASDVAWARALADSLPLGRARDRASVALARYALTRGDTAAARVRLLPLLARYRLTPWAEPYSFDSRDVVSSVMDAGATDEALRWARGRAEVTDRAASLLRVGRELVRRSPGGEDALSRRGYCGDPF